ncbi:MAG: DUF2971 domain-containing protein [Roseburia sp.]|nr:DUF2971 domain-containing protein [Roseburia sp.]MCM1097517.1 DUF2971 domain-containing protein [Ruminococcus flavefaciens]
MVTNREKEEKLNKILEKLSTTRNSDECSVALHKLLIDDCGGKLYKYTSIKEYTISAIVNNTLHFSSPSVFNDPFDCKIGIDYSTLVEALYQDEFKKIESYFSDFLTLKSGRKTIDEMSAERLPIICQWENNKKLINFIDKMNDTSFTDEEMNKTLVDNFDVVLEVLNPLLDSISDEKKVPITPAMLSEVLKNMSVDGKVQLVQSRGAHSDCMKNFGMDIDTDEINLTEKVYEKIYPENKEATKQMKKFFDTLEKELNELFYMHFKVCCLCTSNKNKLMWSHYADSHKGICIEYDFSRLVAEMQPMPVIYTNARLQFPWEVAVKATQENQSEAITHFMKALLTKDQIWSYENEWRLIVQADSGKDDITAPPIKCIYLGALCSDENKSQIKAVADKLSIPVRQMEVDRGKYELHAANV